MRFKIAIYFMVPVILLAIMLGQPAIGGGGRVSALTTSAGPFVEGEVLVQFKPGLAASSKASAHSQAGGQTVAEIDRTGVQLVSVQAGREDAAINAYLRNPNVLTASPNYLYGVIKPVAHSAGSEVVPGDFYFDEQWGLHNTGQQFYCIPWISGELCFYIGTLDADIDAPEGWAISTGAGVKVAVIDTGIDYTHPDLASRYAGGYDFMNDDADPMDDMFHGTHVASIAAAAMNNLTGDPAEEEGVAGVAPDAQILAYKVCDANGICPDFVIQQGIAQAILDGAKVINMSLGAASLCSPLLDNAVQDAWNAGLVVVAAAGNDGTTEQFCPAAFENVVSVAAFDEDDGRASFSNYGSWVDMSAPGNVILGAMPVSMCGGTTTVPGDTGCYDWLNGTSMASPHVAGAAALLWAREDVTTNSQVVDLLLQSADGAGVASVRLDSWTIHGGLNVHDALSLGTTAPTPTPSPSATATPSPTATATATPSATATPPATDVVRVTKVSYNARRDELKVEATSSGAPGAVLTAFDNSDPLNPVQLGQLTYNSKKKVYAGTFSLPVNPGGILVTSSLGGSDTW